MFLNQKIQSKNIPILYFVAFLQGMMFFLPILSLYYQESLFTVKNVAFIFSIEAFASIFFEVPTGAIADLFGRKRTLILANIIFILGIFILFIGGNMTMFILYAILASLAHALNSGTDTALMYDTLLNEGKKNEYKKLSGIYMSLWPIGASVGSIIGGYLATFSFRNPVIYSLITFSISLIMLFFLVEPKFEKKIGSTINKHIWDSFKYVIKNNQLIIILIGGTVAWAFGESTHFLSQIFFQYKQIPIVWYGYLSALSFGFSSLGFYFSHSISNFFGEKRTLIACIIFTGALVTLSTQLPGFFAIFLFIFSSFFFGLRSPILGYLWNQESPSHNRATLNSINSLVYQLGVAIIIPIVGYWSDLYSINTAFLLSGLIILVIPTMVFIFLKDTGSAPH